MSMSETTISGWKLSGIACASAILSFLAPRTVMAQELCGQTTDADIVIMIDLTGSISNSALGLERNAAKILLDVFAPANPRPRVAIGTFNGPCDQPSQGDCASLIDNARLLSDLTDDYGAPGSGLFATIDGISRGPNSGQTDLSAAIDVAQGVLDGASGQGRHIILISDGTPTIPNPDPGCELVQGSGPNDFHVCECTAADNAALAAKDNAEAAGTQIFAIHFDDGSGFTCPGEPVGGTSFMRELATTASTFFEGTDDLSGVFDLIAADIICDDDTLFCNGAESCVGAMGWSATNSPTCAIATTTRIATTATPVPPIVATRATVPIPRLPAVAAAVVAVVAAVAAEMTIGTVCPMRMMTARTLRWMKWTWSRPKVVLQVNSMMTVTACLTPMTNARTLRRMKWIWSRPRVVLPARPMMTATACPTPSMRARILRRMKWAWSRPRVVLRVNSMVTGTACPMLMTTAQPRRQTKLIWSQPRDALPVNSMTMATVWPTPMMGARIRHRVLTWMISVATPSLLRPSRLPRRNRPHRGSSIQTTTKASAACVPQAVCLVSWLRSSRCW